MRIRLAMFGMAAAACLASGAAAQGRPDFSGRWTIEPEAAAAVQRGGEQGAAAGARGGRGGRGAGRGARVGDMGSGWGSTITIAQTATRLMVEYTFFARGDMQPPLRFVYALDGSQTKNSVLMGRGVQEQVSTAAWEGDRLVITTLHPFTDPATGQALTAEVKRVLSLESSETLVVETTRAGVLGGPPSMTRTVYRRQ